MNIEDLTGKRFGKLVVKKRVENDKYGNVVWLCDCDCGKTTKALNCRLKNGSVKSCGCLHKEIMFSHLHKENKYDLSGTYGIGWTFNTNQEFYFDLDDCELIKKYCWLENDQGYIIAKNIDGNHPLNIRMHRLVTDYKYKIVDHINTKRNDNRKANLRECTKQTNNINRDKNINNKLKEKGIYRLGNSYQAKIQKDGKSFTKNSKDIEFLKVWRSEKEKELYGEFSYSGGN